MNIHTSIPTIYGYFDEKFKAEWTATVDGLRAAIGAGIEEVLMPKEALVDMPTVFIKKADAHRALEHLKSVGFNFLTDYTATDEEQEPRFHLVIHLMSLATKCRIRIKIRLNDQEKMPTLTNLWEGANWAEREIYDMFGIHFEGHPDLRRILMDMRWEGHPLRKDYPLKGYQVFLTPEPLDPELLK